MMTTIIITKIICSGICHLILIHQFSWQFLPLQRLFQQRLQPVLLKQLHTMLGLDTEHQNYQMTDIL